MVGVKRLIQELYNLKERRNVVEQPQSDETPTVVAETEEQSSESKDSSVVVPENKDSSEVVPENKDSSEVVPENS